MQHFNSVPVCVCMRAPPRGVSLLYHGVVDKRICPCDTTDYCCLVSAQEKDCERAREEWQLRSAALIPADRNVVAEIFLHLLKCSVFSINDLLSPLIRKKKGGHL